MSRELPTVRISAQGRDQLVRLKRYTGIAQWNTLCRWAFAASIAEGTALGMHALGEMSNIEMSWRTFAGQFAPVIQALATQSAVDCGQSSEPQEMLIQHHIHRGLGILSSKVATKLGLFEMFAGFAVND